MRSTKPTRTVPIAPIKLVCLFFVALIVVHAVNMATGMALCGLGIVPRSLIGLRGIVFAPLIHGSISHLLSNLTPMGILLGAFLCWTKKQRQFVPIIVGIWFLCGLGTWLIGRPNTICFGASGLVYGLASFFLTEAVTERSWWPALVVLITFPMYASLVWGLMHFLPGVSWECHLCGAIAGFLVARAV